MGSGEAPDIGIGIIKEGEAKKITDGSMGVLVQKRRRKRNEWGGDMGKDDDNVGKKKFQGNIDE